MNDKGLWSAFIMDFFNSNRESSTKNQKRIRNATKTPRLKEPQRFLLDDLHFVGLNAYDVPACQFR
jgi:hypothetical protein